MERAIIGLLRDGGETAGGTGLPGCGLIFNEYIAGRILRSIKECGDCYVWTRKNPIVTIAGKQKHCRRIFYECYYGRIKEQQQPGNIIQLCGQQYSSKKQQHICVRPEHLRHVSTHNKEISQPRQRGDVDTTTLYLTKDLLEKQETAVSTDNCTSIDCEDEDALSNVPSCPGTPDYIG
jgi:hypothetical protein